MIAANTARRPALAALLVAPLLLALAACGSGSDGQRLARADAKYALEVLDRAPEHGFAPGAFHVRELHRAVDSHDPKTSTLLAAAVVEYASAQHGLAIARAERPAAWGAKPPSYDAAADMKTALAGHKFRQWLDAQPPATPLYQALQKSYVAELARPGGAAAAGVIRANLERLRWLPRDEPATRIDVNIAAATLIYVVDGQPRLTMRTASGKPGDETPMLASKIDHIVLNPPWNVPDNIANEELIPKGPDYLASRGFVTNEEGRLVQQPSPESALGLVKFDFDNPYAVYLHDTPSKAAFGRNGRAVSHGCVRLERAIDLANAVLAGQSGWSPQRLQEVLASAETVTVKLARPVPVRLLYLTAVPSEGRIVLLPDVYGWDNQVLERLDRATAGARI